MNSITLNISLPQAMYTDIKAAVLAMRFTSVSEFIRDATRKLLYPQLTENGFTKEFEDMVLRSEKSDMKNDIVWEGKESDLVDYVKSTKKSNLHPKSTRTFRGATRSNGRSGYAGAVV